MATIVTGDQYHVLTGKLLEIHRQLRQKGGYPYDPRRLDVALQSVIEGRFDSDQPSDLTDPIKQWQTFYEKVGIKANLSDVKIPEKKIGFDRLIIVAKGLTNNLVFSVCEKHFPCYRRSDNLDKGVPTNDRTTGEAYAIWIRDRVEADEELKNLSADMLTDQKIKGITLLERMILELKYFLETGKHLDIDNWTLCSGSRGSGGSVPGAGWGDGGFYVSCGRRAGRGPSLCCREVVSLAR